MICVSSAVTHSKVHLLQSQQKRPPSMLSRECHLTRPLLTKLHISPGATGVLLDMNKEKTLMSEVSYIHASKRTLVPGQASLVQLLLCVPDDG